MSTAGGHTGGVDAGGGRAEQTRRASRAERLDQAFIGLIEELLSLVAPVSVKRHIAVRVGKWVEKLREPCVNVRFKQSRNDHAALLLKHTRHSVQTQDSSVLPPPFDRNPAPGPLKTLPAHSVLCLRQKRRDKKRRHQQHVDPPPPPTTFNKKVYDTVGDASSDQQDDAHSQQATPSENLRNHKPDSKDQISFVNTVDLIERVGYSRMYEDRRHILPKHSVSAPATPLRTSTSNLRRRSPARPNRVLPRHSRVTTRAVQNNRNATAQENHYSNRESNADLQHDDLLERSPEEDDSSSSHSSSSSAQNLEMKHASGKVREHDVHSNSVGDDGASFASASLDSIRRTAEQRAASALDHLSSLSRTELESKVHELQAIVKAQQFQIEQLQSEVRIQKGMRSRGEKRQIELHRLELDRLARETEVNIQIATMETSRHPAEMLLEQRLRDVVDFQNKKSGENENQPVDRKLSRKEISKMKRDVIAKGIATGQLSNDDGSIKKEEDEFMDRVTAPVGPGGLPSPPSLVRRGHSFKMPNSPARDDERMDPPDNDDDFLEYLESFQRKTTAMAEGLR